MSEATKAEQEEPLVLNPTWRLADWATAGEGATIHPLRVVHTAPRGRSDRAELQAIVAELVREELRSDLGRRMTSSIRSLVRDEVARVFARLARR